MNNSQAAMRSSKGVHPSESPAQKRQESHALTSEEGDDLLQGHALAHPLRADGHLFPDGLYEGYDIPALPVLHLWTCSSVQKSSHYCHV